MSASRQSRRGRWFLAAMAMMFAGSPGRAAPQLDEDGLGPPPPPCSAKGTLLPNGRTYRVQGRIRQDCRQTPYGAVLNLPGYKVDVMVSWQLQKKCPSLPSTQPPMRIGSLTTGFTGFYSFSITSAGLNSVAPEHYDILGVKVGIRLVEPASGTIIGTTPFTAWSSSTTAIRDFTVTDDCPTDRLNEPNADEPVWRVQLRLITSGASNADTENSVNCRLNPRNDTWMNYARDDFERNDDFTYDLLPIEISQRSDINKIVITKEGTDFWAIKRIQLLVNEVPMYDESFSGQGLWLNNSAGFSPTYTINYYKLRNNPAWSAWTPPSLSEAAVIPAEDLVDRLEGLLGHLAKLGGAEMEGEHLYGPAVEIEQVDSETLAVDFDLTKAVNNWDDAEVDIDFHVHFSCDESEAPIELRNLHVGVDSFLDFFSSRDDEAKDKLRFQITQNFEKFVNRLYDGNAEGSCPCVNQVLDDGGLILFGARPCPVIEEDEDGSVTPPIRGLPPINGVLTLQGSGGTTPPTRNVAVTTTTTTAARR